MGAQKCTVQAVYSRTRELAEGVQQGCEIVPGHGPRGLGRNGGGGATHLGLQAPSQALTTVDDGDGDAESTHTGDGDGEGENDFHMEESWLAEVNDKGPLLPLFGVY